MFDGAVASEQAFAQSVMAVAESGLPRHNRVFGIFKSYDDRVRHLASIFLREHATTHACCARLRQIKRRHDPGDLVNHVLRHIPAGKLPIQPPIDELEGIKFAIRPPVEKGFPGDVLRGAVRGHLTHPLTLAMRRVATHPRLDLRNLPDYSV